MADHGNSKEVVRLCEQVVRQALGDVVCRVASTLLNRGRLASFSIARLAGIPRPTTLSALILLMQHNLVLSNGASAKESGAEEMYEFDVHECLLRLRWGRMLSITQERLGPLAVEVVRQVMLYGKLKATDIVSACGAGYDAQYAAQVNEAIITLVRSRFLEPTAPELHIIQSDRVERRYAMMRRERNKVVGFQMLSANEIQAMRDRAAHEIRVESEELRDPERALIKKELPGRKKGRKEEYDYSIRPQIPLRLNYDRFAVIIRDELIAKAAHDRWNIAAEEIVRALLGAVLNGESKLADDRSGAANINQILERIPNAAYPTLAAGIAGVTSKSASEVVRQYLAVMAGTDLMDRSKGAPFLGGDDSSNPVFHVELEAIAVRIRASLMMELVRERLGSRAARVLATVAKAHKITEQAVRNCAMMPLREARVAMAELQRMSLIETSEIPKNPHLKRQTMTAASEHHHWAMDLPRAYNVLLTSVYKTLANILQRQASEREKRKGALGREEQAIAKGADRSVLLGKDREDLAELDDVVRKLTLAEARCEMVVFILRDLPGWPTRRA